MVSELDWNKNRVWIDRDDADIEKYVAGIRERLDFDLRAKLSEWRDTGIVTFENVVDRALIDQLLEDIRFLVDHHEAFELTVEIQGSHKPIQSCAPAELLERGTKLNNIQTISLAAAKLSLTKQVCQFLGHVFTDHAAVLQSLTFFRGSQQPVHLDYPYVRCQTKIPHLAASWVPLEDISPESGPLAYYPGSHRAQTLGFFDWGGGSILYEPDSVRTPIEFSNHLYERLAKSGIERKLFLPKKGDVLIWHGSLAHEGTNIGSPDATRRSYVTHYTSFQGYPPLHMKPRALEAGHFITRHGGYVFEYPWLKSDKKLPSWSAA